MVYATQNALANHISNVSFKLGDLFGPVGNMQFDCIVSNPPYVGSSEEEEVQLEVRKFEPRDAVFAGPTGLEVISRIIPQAGAALNPSGWLIMEISGTMAAGVQRLLESWKDLRLIPDLQSIPRVIRARNPNS